MSRTKPLDGELLRIRDEIHGYALEFGLDFYEVRFEVCDYDTINILAAQGGFPSRYPHWRFGMDYDQLSKGYAYGLQKIYEMVINTNPCYAYLLNANHIVDKHHRHAQAAALIRTAQHQHRAVRAGDFIGNRQPQAGAFAAAAG